MRVLFGFINSNFDCAVVPGIRLWNACNHELCAAHFTSTFQITRSGKCKLQVPASGAEFSVNWKMGHAGVLACFYFPGGRAVAVGFSV